MTLSVIRGTTTASSRRRRPPPTRPVRERLERSPLVGPPASTCSSFVLARVRRGVRRFRRGPSGLRARRAGGTLRGARAPAATALPGTGRRRRRGVRERVVALGGRGGIDRRLIVGTHVDGGSPRRPGARRRRRRRTTASVAARGRGAVGVGHPMPPRFRRRRLASLLPDELLRHPLVLGRRGGGGVSGSSGTLHLPLRPRPRCPKRTHRPSWRPSGPRPSWALPGGSMGGGIAAWGWASAWARRRASRLPRDAVRGSLPDEVSGRRPHRRARLLRGTADRARWRRRDRRLHRNRPIRANRHLRRSSIVLGRLGCDDVSGLRCRGCPVWPPIGRRRHRSRGAFLPRRVMRSATVGRRWLSRHCRPRPGLSWFIW